MTINFHDIPSSTEVQYESRFDGRKKLKIANKKNVYAKELTLFGDDIWSLGILGCKNFNYEHLKDLSGLEVLYVEGQDEFTGDELKDAPESLKKLTVHSCDCFSGRGLNENLKNLNVKNCKNVDINPLSSLENLDELMLHGYTREDFDFSKKVIRNFRKNGCKVSFPKW